MRGPWTSFCCSRTEPEARDRRLGRPVNGRSVVAITKLCHHHHPSSNCRADICPRIKLSARTTKSLAPFIRNEGGWLSSWIRKYPMWRVIVLVDTAVLRKVIICISAGCKIRSHTVDCQVRFKKQTKHVGKARIEKLRLRVSSQIINPAYNAALTLHTILQRQRKASKGIEWRARMWVYGSYPKMRLDTTVTTPVYTSTRLERGKATGGCARGTWLPKTGMGWDGDVLHMQFVSAAVVTSCAKTEPSRRSDGTDSSAAQKGTSRCALGGN